MGYEGVSATLSEPNKKVNNSYLELGESFLAMRQVSLCICGWNLSSPELGHENESILVIIAMNEDGYLEVLGVAEGMKEDKASRVNFFK